MPGEGERREGDENPDKDPFTEYAEELERKQRESNGAPESDQGNSDQDVAQDRAPESPKMDVEVGLKEFEAYAKELKEKYDEEESSADPSQVSQGPAGANGDVTSQGGQPSGCLNEQTQESNSPGPQQATDSATDGIRPKPSDGGHYQQNVNNESGKLNDRITPPDSEQSTSSSPGKPGPEKVPLNGNTGKSSNGEATATPETALNRAGRQREADRHAERHENSIPSSSHGIENQREKDPGISKALESATRGDPTEVEEQHVFTIRGSQTQRWVNIDTERLESTGLLLPADGREVNTILEVHGRIAGGESVRRFFGMYHPASGNSLSLRLDRDEAEIGDSFEVIKTKAHSIDSFVDEIMRAKPKGMENVDLIRDTRGLLMKVDESEYQIHNPRLDVYGSRAELTGRLMPANRRIQFQLQGERMLARLESHQISAMRVTNNVLDISYQHSNRVLKTHHFRFASVVEGKATAISANETERTFDIRVPKRLFRGATGMLLEVGKEYVIQGRVQGVCEFRVNHFESEKATKRSHVILSLGKESQGKLKHKERYGIVIDSVVERRDFHVTGRRNEVKISKSSVNSLGLNKIARGKSEIIELRAKNLAKPDTAVSRYFLTSRPDAATRLRLGELRGRRGDTLRFENPKRYVLRKFVNDFKTHKPENLRNVDLDFNKNHITMYVDGKGVILRNPRLDAFGLQAVLKANIENTGRKIIFYFDGERIKPKLFSSYGIQSLRASDSGLEITYLKDRTETRTFLFRFNPFDKTAMKGNVALVSFSQKGGGSYHFRASPSFRKYMATRLDNLLRNLGKYRLRAEKGNDSEEIQHYLLSMIPGWEKVAEHPFNTSPKVDSAMKTGPDSIYRLKKTNDLNYVESKWDNEASDAFSAGSKQVRRYLLEYPEYNKEKVKGGYVGIVNWDTRSRDLFFYLRKVESTKLGSQDK